MRCVLASAKGEAEGTSVTGAAMPKSGQIELGDEGGLCWMSPDELLVLVHYAEVEQTLAQINASLAGEHALAVNVSDARAVFRVSGDGAREVLAKLCPVDLSAEAFVPGQFRRTRMAQVAAAFWLDHDGVFHIVCFRSVADYVFSLLSTGANAQSKVGVYA